MRAVAIAAMLTAGLALSACGNSDTKSASKPPSSPAPSASATTANAAGFQPTKVVLPGGLSATLEPKSLSDDGELPIPEDVNVAAWWGAGLGAEKGTTLLSGHVNWKGRKGPFEKIHHVKKGEHVHVTDVNGKAWDYTISEILHIDKAELPAKSDELFSRTGPHRLVLVTCSGEYVGGETGYEANEVVVATL